MPAFRPKPTSARTKIAVASAGRQAVRVQRSEREGAAGRAQQGEQGEQAQGRRVGRHQVDPAGLADLLLVVLGRDQKEGRQGHDLPAEQEQDAVAGDHQQGHAGGQRAVEQAQLAAVLRMLRLLPVAQAVDVAQQRDQEDRQQEDGRQAVHGHAELGAGDGPRQHDRLTVAGRPERSRRRPSPSAAPSTASSVVTHCPLIEVRPSKRPGTPLDAAMTIPRSTSDSLMTCPTTGEGTPRPGPVRP